MKKIIIVLVLLFAMGGQLYARDLGTPMILKKDSAWGVDLGYYSQNSKIMPTDTSLFSEKKMSQTHLYCQVNRVLGSRVEAYLRIGASDLIVHQAFNFSDISYISDENQNLSSQLDAKNSELSALQQTKTNEETTWLEGEEDRGSLLQSQVQILTTTHEATIVALDKSIADKQAEISSLNSAISGIANLTENNTKDFTSNFQLFTSIGGKVVLFHLEESDLLFSLFFQGTRYGNYAGSKTEQIGEATAKQDVSINLDYSNMWTMLAGLGVQTIFVDGSIGYITLFSEMLSVDVTAERNSPTSHIKTSTKYKSKSNLGFLIGLSYPLGDTFNLNVESGYKDGISFGISVRDTF